MANTQNSGTTAAQIETPTIDTTVDTTTTTQKADKYELSASLRNPGLVLEYRGNNIVDDNTLTKNAAFVAVLLPKFTFPDNGNATQTFTASVEVLGFEAARDKVRLQEIKYKKTVDGAEKDMSLTTVKAAGKDDAGNDVMYEKRVIMHFKYDGKEYSGNVPASFVLAAEQSANNSINVLFSANKSGRTDTPYNLWANLPAQ